MTMRASTLQRFVSGARLMSASVRDQQGEAIGKIEDYMFDTTSGCMDHAVLSFGGFLGFGGRLFAVPWNALSIDPEHYSFVMNVTKEQLEQAPSFDRGGYPDPNDQDYIRRVAGYWGVGYPAGETARGGGDPGTYGESGGYASQTESVERAVGEPGSDAPYRPGTDYPQGGGDWAPRMPGEPGADHPPGGPANMPERGGYPPGRAPEEEPRRAPDRGGYDPGRGGDI